MLMPLKLSAQKFLFLMEQLKRLQHYITFEENYHVLFEGKIEGIISEKIKGKNGFGYDPIFLPNGSLKTFGEMTDMEKNFHSHRGIAINKLINFLFN